MIIDDDTYLSHVGVKGMKWGVRKQRDSSGEGSPKRKKPPLTTEQKLRRVQIGLVVAGGILTAASIIQANRSVKIGPPKIPAGPSNRTSFPAIPLGPVKTKTPLRVIPGGDQRSKETKKWLDDNVFPKAKDLKMDDIRPSPSARKKIAQMSPETKKFLRDFDAKQRLLNREANADLKAQYESLQVPLHLREYLSDWT